MPPRPRILRFRRLQQQQHHHHARHHSSTTTTTSSAPTTSAARTYCADLLAKSDYTSSLLTPLQHPLARDAHLAIRAFNLDIASIDTTTSTPSIGQLRMTFWRDAITKTFSGHPPAEPVAVLLASVLHSGGAPLSKSFFLRLINAREQYLGRKPFPSLEALERYAEDTYGSLQYLALESVHTQSAALDHVGSHIGKACGIAAVLRGIPHLAMEGDGGVVLPLDVCAEHGLRQEDVLRHGSEAPGLRDAVFKVATLANDHLITARKMLADAGKEGAQPSAFATFLPAVPTAMYLERLEKADFNPFERSLMKRPWSLPWRLYRAVATKQF